MPTLNEAKKMTSEEAVKQVLLFKKEHNKVPNTGLPVKDQLDRFESSKLDADVTKMLSKAAEQF